MKLFALSDPHLSFDHRGQEYKPMGIFGDSWLEHGAKIRRNWLEVVQEEDVVLLPGDISWAMTLEDVKPDLNFLAELPGRKIISKGNHDFWWNSMRKVCSILPAGFDILQNNSFVFGHTAVCGTRGWPCPESGSFADSHDEKIFQRELGRLQLSLNSVPEQVTQKIVMLHYPPVNGLQKSAFVELMEQHGVTICLYGHLHSYAIHTALEGLHWGIDFQLVSADYLHFRPKCILEAV